jgi:hypothetical protein
MIKKISLSVICFLLITASANAENFATDKDLKPFTDKVMDLVVKGDLKKAFETMKPYVVVSEADMQTAEQKSETQREQFTERYGAPIGYEFIAQKATGESLIRIVYIEKLEKQALVWAFYFYKAKSGWMLNSVIWDDQMPYLFQMN